MMSLTIRFSLTPADMGQACLNQLCVAGYGIAAHATACMVNGIAKRFFGSELSENVTALLRLGVTLTAGVICVNFLPPMVLTSFSIQKIGELALFTIVIWGADNCFGRKECGLSSIALPALLGFGMGIHPALGYLPIGVGAFYGSGV